MATFETIEVTIERIKAFEGESLKRFSAQTDLGLADNDAVMAVEAQRQVKLDIVDDTNKYYYNSTYDTITELLDAIADKDEDSMIERLMTIKFLELFYADQSIDSDMADKKASYYESKYFAELPKTTTSLLANLDTPKVPNRPKFVR